MRARRLLITVPPLALLAFAIVAYAQPPSGVVHPPNEASKTPLQLGSELYAANCASCHGDGGEGKDAPRVVGLDKGALPLDPPAGAKIRKVPFRTAADVAGFVVTNMPPYGGKKLSEPEYWSILAFDLHANGVDLPSKLDAASAGAVVLHK